MILLFMNNRTANNFVDDKSHNYHHGQITYPCSKTLICRMKNNVRELLPIGSAVKMKGYDQEGSQFFSMVSFLFFPLIRI